MPIRFLSIPSETAAALRAGGPDANGQPPERAVSDGPGNPCRHCLRNISEGAPMLIFAIRPFETLHPYAETGPAFLHADACAPFSGEGPPPILAESPDYLLKGYTAEGRIAYGTGRITAHGDVAGYAADLLAGDRLAWVDVRSARNNCWLTRAVRA
ncbi:uncharacterized protein DUF1203 [Hasllibacter halocynthiae]|uniref:Uncharacterized protein DUF1203 n=1 Tax=Hasllibacter halocynthiae TaxID=595589 RepID=A0A2T0X8Q2_9RHOB|nr:DUF1203 domain-containing protein [Hasllibacter halocynthiae]PRY95297.1 uncharacterized protein DUF1203 [Hasllibacter halocynthiae]